MEKSRSKQVPWESTSLRGNFYFSAIGKYNRFNEDQPKSKIEVANVPKSSSYPQPASTSNVIERDGVYETYANGIVKDMRTGLEWKVGPDKDTDWKEAKSWVKSLMLDGGGWRMPTLQDLRGLYKKGEGDCNMTSLLKTTGWYIWAGSAGGSSRARGFIFYTGMSLGRHRSIISNDWRAFAVRFRTGG